MKNIIIIAILIGTLVGCNQLTVSEAREEAYGRWFEVRAKTLCSLGEEQLKVGQLDHAGIKAQDALALKEDFFEARILLSKVYIEQGHYVAAKAQLDKAIELNPKSTEAMYLTGVALEKDGKCEQALKYYRKVHSLDSENLSAVMAATEVLVAMGRIREAQLNIESYTSISGDEPGIFELAGRIAMMQKEYRKAAGFFSQASDINYQHIGYRESLARAQFKAGLYPQVIETIETLLDSKDYSAGAWVYTMLGDSYIAASKPYKARNAYYKASELDPENPGVWSNIAKSAIALGDMHRAVISARQALQIDDGFLDATILLGYAMIENGQSSAAIKILNRSVSIHPKSSALLCLLGRGYAAIGKDQEARNCFAQALRVDPENELARELLEKREVTELSKLD